MKTKLEMMNIIIQLNKDVTQEINQIKTEIKNKKELSSLVELIEAFNQQTEQKNNLDTLELQGLKENDLKPTSHRHSAASVSSIPSSSWHIAALEEHIEFLRALNTQIQSIKKSERLTQAASLENVSLLLQKSVATYNQLNLITCYEILGLERYDVEKTNILFAALNKLPDALQNQLLLEDEIADLKTISPADTRRRRPLYEKLKLRKTELQHVLETLFNQQEEQNKVPLRSSPMIDNDSPDDAPSSEWVDLGGTSEAKFTQKTYDDQDLDFSPFNKSDVRSNKDKLFGIGPTGILDAVKVDSSMIKKQDTAAPASIQQPPLPPAKEQILSFENKNTKEIISCLSDAELILSSVKEIQTKTSQGITCYLIKDDAKDYIYKLYDAQPELDNQHKRYINVVETNYLVRIKDESIELLDSKTMKSVSSTKPSSRLALIQAKVSEVLESQKSLANSTVVSQSSSAKQAMVSESANMSTTSSPAASSGWFQRALRLFSGASSVPSSSPAPTVLPKRALDYNQFPDVFSLGFFGEKQVGKSCLILRYTEDIYTDSYISTIGESSYKQRTVIKPNTENETRIVLYDYEPPKFCAISLSHHRLRQGSIYCYDPNNENTMSDLNSLIECIYKCAQDKREHFICIFETKIDREGTPDDRPEIRKQVRQFAKEHNIPYMRVSAKTGKGFDEAFQAVIDEYLIRKGAYLDVTSSSAVSKKPPSVVLNTVRCKK